MTQDEFKNFVPLALHATEHANWSDLMRFVELEILKKEKMLRSPSISLETVRYLQGVLEGLAFVTKLPVTLRKDYHDIIRDSKDSQNGETND